MWNSLSEDTVQARTVNELKSRLRRDWRGHPDLYNYPFFKLTSLDKPDKKHMKKIHQYNKLLWTSLLEYTTSTVNNNKTI